MKTIWPAAPAHPESAQSDEMRHPKKARNPAPAWHALVDGTRTGRKRAMLCIAFAETWILRPAAAVAQVHRATHYRWLKRDPIYRDAFAEAKEEAIGNLEFECRRRALGIPSVRLYEGKVIMVPRDLTKPQGPDNPLVPLVEMVYSDTLLIFLLKAARPEIYCDRATVELRPRPLYEPALMNLTAGCARTGAN
jgi:hypothetical protein